MHSGASIVLTWLTSRDTCYPPAQPSDQLPPIGYDPNKGWQWVGNPSSDPTEESRSESHIGEDGETPSSGTDDGADDSDEEDGIEDDQDGYRYFHVQSPVGDRGLEAWQTEFARKWEHYERKEKRRLMREIGPPQLFRHPGIETKMWERTSSSSQDPESGEDGEDIDADEPPYLLKGGSVDSESNDNICGEESEIGQHHEWVRNPFRKRARFE